MKPAYGGYGSVIDMLVALDVAETMNDMSQRKGEPMGRLIDANALMFTDFEIVMCDGDFKKAFKLLTEKIENAPTIEPKRGHWIYPTDETMPPFCSRCKAEAIDYTESDYCPNCGAKMQQSNSKQNSVGISVAETEGVDTDDPSHPFADDVMMGDGVKELGRCKDCRYKLYAFRDKYEVDHDPVCNHPKYATPVPTTEQSSCSDWKEAME